ncbi:hypothetical protein CRUP_030565 [Coryphaenoides rupestris]|nr:hypothetical protein CRUP_030565 [Coryphaenoides rupestris]
MSPPHHQGETTPGRWGPRAFRGHEGPGGRLPSWKPDPLDPGVWLQARVQGRNPTTGQETEGCHYRDDSLVLLSYLLYCLGGSCERSNLSESSSFGSQKVPQAIIIGVKKGGTRALLEFLRFHPVHGTNLQLDYTGTQATRVESFANGLCFSKLPLKPGEIFLIEIEEKEPGWCGHLRVGLTAHDPAGLEVVPEYSLPDMMELGDSWIFAITRNHNKVPEQVAAEGEGGEAEGEEGEAEGETREGGRRLGRRPGEEEEEALARARREETSSKPQRFFTDSHLHIGDFRIPREKLVGRSRPGRFSHILDDLYKSHALPPTARRSRIGVLYVPRGRGQADMHIIINGEDMGASARGIPAHRPMYAVVDVFAATKCVRIVQVEYGFSSLQTLCRKEIQRSIVHRMALDRLELPEALKHFCKRSNLSESSSFGSQKVPQAIIIGVKKGGTRALLEFLRVHPKIRALGAEPHFFDRFYDQGLEWYSTKLIVVVRDPVTRAVSDYTQTLSKAPGLPSFRSLAFRNGSLSVDTSWSAVRIGVYAKHLDNWLRYFPLSHFLFVSGERLVSDPAGEVGRVQDFLGLKRVVTNKHFYFNQTKGFPCLKKPEGSSRPRCLGKSKGRAHPRIPPEVLRALRDFYRPFNRKFYQMTDQDFGWD